jgi:heat shock protein HslJ
MRRWLRHAKNRPDSLGEFEMKKNGFTWTVAAMFIVSATTAFAASPNGVAQGEWVLETVTGKRPSLAEPVTMQIAGDRLSGSDGCNRINAGISFGRNNIMRVGQIASTMMACAEPAMRFAQSYANALNSVRRYSIQNGKLVLLDAKGRQVARYARQTQAIANLEWGVIAYNNGSDAIESNLISETMSISLLSGGEVRGFGGCRTFAGRYTIDETQRKLNFGTEFVHLSRNGCTAEAEQEQKKFETALCKVASYRRDGNSIELLSKGGTVSVQLKLKARLEK